MCASIRLVCPALHWLRCGTITDGGSAPPKRTRGRAHKWAWALDALSLVGVTWRALQVHAIPPQGIIVATHMASSFGQLLVAMPRHSHTTKWSGKCIWMAFGHTSASWPNVMLTAAGPNGMLQGDAIRDHQ
ncbi:hypothetical protein B0H13DRAFT_1933796 [Mycena leptocephala]|nr:hypothetical protein B0H13DRAFT_1933796 [Mycena leptocephala]